MDLPNCRALLLAPALSLLAPLPVCALEAAAGDNGEPVTLEQVYVTATRSKRSDLEVAAAVTAVGAEKMLGERPGVIAAALRAEPGVFFQQTTPGQGVPIIRGLKGSQVLHLIDGMRINNALFRNAPNQYLGLIDGFSAERVEVVRGAQGSLYGADAMGGVMQVLTSEPDYDTRAWRQENRLYASYDSVDDGVALSARSSGGHAGFGFAGGASYQRHGSRRAGGGARQRPSGYRSKAADVKFLAGLGEDASMMLSAQAMEQPSTPRYDELVAGFGQTEPSSEQFLFRPNRREFIHARLRLFGRSAWFEEFEAHAARQVITDDRLSQGFQSPVIVTERNRSTLDGLTLQFNTVLQAVTRLVWGAEYYTDAIDSHRFEIDGGPGTLTEVRSRFPDGASMDSAALYASAEWPLLQDLAVRFGLRYSHFDIRLPATDEYGAVNLTPADLTGDLHAVYDLRPGIRLVANVGRGFRPPNVFDLATLGPRPGNRYNIANPALQPETVMSYDLGIKAETGDSELELFVFRMDYADKITSVGTGATTADGRAIVRSENRSRATIYGLEANLEWSPGERATTFLVLNFTHGREHDDDGAYPADRIPPLNGRLGLRYRLAREWTIEPYTTFAARQDRLSPRDLRDPRIDPRGTPGWMTLNVGVRFQPSAGLQIGLRLQNLTDENYREHASGIDAAGRNIGAWASYLFP